MKFMFNYVVLVLSSSLIFYSCQNTSPDNSNIENDEGLILEQGGFEKDIIDIELEYFSMMCPCPQWATPQNVKLYKSSVKSGNPISMDSLFMLVWPLDEKALSPFQLEGWNKNGKNDIFTFTGRYYKEKYKWKSEDGIEWNCRVFKYSNCKIIQ